MAESPTDLPKCDFCSARPVTAYLHTVTFTYPFLDWTSISDWAACAACFQDVRLGARQSMVHRACRAAAQREGGRWQVYVLPVELAHAGFWRHYLGVYRLVTDDQDGPSSDQST